MSILSGYFKTKRYRMTDSGYKLQSEWTSSDTVEMPNGKTLSENTIELTQAEYDTLDDLKLTDDVDYYITDTQKHIRNGIEYGGSSSSIKLDTTLSVEGKAADAKAVGDAIDGVTSNMYYDPVTDGEYRKNEEGEWIFIGTAGLKQLPLYVNGNQGNFVGYMGGISPYTGDSIPSLTIGESLIINSNGFAGSAISDKYDLTRFSKLKFHHNSVTGANANNNASVFITDTKQSAIIPVVSKELVRGGNKNVNGDEELDITNLSGEYYIGFYLQNNSGGVTVTISDMYLN